MKPFFTNVLVVLRGTAISQIALIAAMPVLSRLFAPEAFGVIQGLQSILTFMLVASALRLEIAILSETEDALPGLLRACVWVSFAMNLALLLVIAILSRTMHQRLDHLFPVLWIVPLASLLATWGAILTYLVLREKAFGASANAKIGQTVGYVGAALVAARGIPTALGLGLSDIIGKGLYCALLVRGRVAQFRDRPAPLRDDMESTLRVHRSLVTISLPGALINVLSSSYTPLLMLMVFNARSAGEYALVERVIGGPIAMIGAAASQVFMAGLGETIRTSPTEARRLYRSIIGNQFKLGALPALALVVFAPFAIPVIFGHQWTMAGRYAQILAPVFYLSFVLVPVNMALTVTGHRSLQLALDFGRLLLTVATWGSILKFGLTPVPALALHCATSILSMVAYLYAADVALANGARLLETPGAPMMSPVAVSGDASV